MAKKSEAIFKILATYSGNAEPAASYTTPAASVSLAEARKLAIAAAQAPNIEKIEVIFSGQTITVIETHRPPPKEATMTPP